MANARAAPLFGAVFPDQKHVMIVVMFNNNALIIIIGLIAIVALSKVPSGASNIVRGGASSSGNKIVGKKVRVNSDSFSLSETGIVVTAIIVAVFAGIMLGVMITQFLNEEGIDWTMAVSFVILAVADIYLYRFWRKIHPPKKKKEKR